MYTFLSSTRATCPTHLIFLDFIIRTFGEQHKPCGLHCALFCNLLFLPASWAPISSSVLNFKTPSSFVPPLKGEARFHTHSTQQTKLHIWIFHSLYLRQRLGKQQILNCIVANSH
jgi:hypothetical protein